MAKKEEELKVKIERTYILERVEHFSYLGSDITVDYEQKG